MQTKQELRNIRDDSAERIEAGNCTIDDAFMLLNNPLILFSFADRLRKKAAGDRVTYVINRNINFTNMCIGTCKFCAFKKEEGYIMSIPEILEKTRAAAKINATEVCIQGGLLPDWDVLITAIFLRILRMNSRICISMLFLQWKFIMLRKTAIWVIRKHSHILKDQVLARCQAQLLKY